MAATYYDLPPILERIGDWAITRTGLQCLTTRYEIESSRLDETDWEHHMSGKGWVNMNDFSDALSKIRALRDCGYVD